MTKETKATRRDFLILAGTTAPLAAVAVAAGTDTAEAAQPDLTLERMQDTAHTRAFYETARF
jgi:hypothetical protein